jgi:hypothetical protein
MNLYLDDDSAKASLVRLLRKVGHQVVIPLDAGISGEWDARHLMRAVKHGLVLLTKNHDDFEDLDLLVHITGSKHPGLLVVRSDNDPSRDMKDGDIARALSNLQRAGAPVADESPDSQPLALTSRGRNMSARQTGVLFGMPQSPRLLFWNVTRLGASGLSNN